MKWELDDLAGTSDLAARYGVGMAAISNWAKRFEDFPQPLAHVSGKPVYSVKQADAWHKRQFGARARKLRERAEDLERKAINLRKQAGRYDTT